MKKKTLLYIMLIVFMQYLPDIYSQQNQISAAEIRGVIVDVKTNQPLEFANFIITSVKDTSVIFGTSTGKDGKFFLEKFPFGVYNAKISLMGYKSRTRKNIVLNERNHLLNIDTVLLMPLNLTLNEIQVLAEKYRVTYDKEDKNKIVINPDKTWGNNAYDLLENSPMINVDIIEGSVRIAGVQKTVIYIDGVPAKYQGMFKGEDLRIIAARDIEKFEIILNPSADYGEEMGSSILNIVTSKEKTSNYNGQFSGRGDNNNLYDGNLSFSYKPNPVMLNGSYSPDYYEQKSDYYQLREQIYNGTPYRMEQSGSRLNKRSNHFVRVTSRYNEKRDMVSASGNYRYLGTKRSSSFINDFSYPLINDNKNLTSSNTGQSFLSTNFMYFKTLENNRTFTIGFNYNRNRMTSSADIEKQEFNNPDNINLAVYNYYEQQENSNNTYQFNVNTRWKFFDLLSTSFRYDGNWSDRNMNSDYGLFADKKTRLNYNDIFHNASFSLESNFGWFYASIAGRFTNKYSYSEENSAGNKFERNVLYFDPSINIGGEFSESSRLMLSYGRVTINPDNRQLNPYNDHTDSTNIIVGNPELKPYFMHSTNLNYNFSFSGITGILGAGFGSEKNGIEQISETTDPQHIITTYKNISRSERQSAMLGMSHSPLKWLDLSYFFDITHRKYDGEIIKNSGTNYSLTINPAFKFSWMRFQFSVHYSNSDYSAQEINPSRFFVNAAAKALLFNKKLSITLRAADLFNTINKDSKVLGSNFSIANSVRQKTQLFSLELGWYFESVATEDIGAPPAAFDLPDDF